MRLTRPLWLLVTCLLAAIGLSAQQPNTMNNGSASSSPAASPKVPRLVKFSGMLRDLTGKPLTGPVDVNFAIYREQADLVPIWYEAQTLQLDEQGRYTVLLGAMQAEGLPMALFTSGEARWLEVYVPGAEPQPRTLLVSVPYALKAGDSETLGGKPASAFMLAQSEESSTQAAPGAGSETNLGAVGGKPKARTAAGGITAPLSVEGTGTPNMLTKWLDTIGTLGDSAVFESGGKVGIGTTSPNANEPYNRLTVAGNDDTALTMGIENAGIGHSGLLIRRTGGTASRWYQYIPGDSTDLRFFDGGDVVTFQAGGKVGIGTTDPWYKLDILDDNASVAGFRLTNPNAGAVAQIQNKLENDVGSFAYYGLASSNFNGFPPIDGGKAFFGAYRTDLSIFTQTAKDIIFYTTAIERMRILLGGNVGIGTTAPGEKLEVAGNVKASGSVTATSFSGDGSGLTNVPAGTASDLNCTGCVSPPELNFDPATQEELNTESAARVTADTTLQAGIEGRVLKSGDTMAGTLNLPANGLVVGTNQLVLSGGNVGIGTVSPAAELDVVGSTSTVGSSIVSVTQQGSTTTPPGPFPTRPPFALLGESSATTGWAVGVGGVAYSPDAYGVEGANLATTGGGAGVRGIALGTSGAGVVGGADADSGSTIGVYGRVNSSSGTAGIFNNLAGGNILRGDSNYVNKFLVDGSGNVRANSYLDLSGNPIGGGTVTSVGSGTGLTGGPITSSGTLSLDTALTDARYAALLHGHTVSQVSGAATTGANSFTGDQSITGNVSASGAALTGANATQIVNVEQSGTGTALIGRFTSPTGAGDGVMGASDSSTDFTHGVVGYTSATTGLTTGVVGSSDSTSGIGVTGYVFTSTGSTVGVKGMVESTAGIAIDGAALASSGATIGVRGTSSSTSGQGVRGEAQASAGGHGIGVLGSSAGDSSAGAAAVGVQGEATSPTGLSFGVRGVNLSSSGTGVSAYATATSGGTVAVYGEVNSSSGTAGVFNNLAGGNILLGQNNYGVNQFRVDGTGKGFFNGGTQTGGADFAESFAVAGERARYGPGDVLVIDPLANRRVALSSRPYSTAVAGIYSTKPGVLATPYEMDDERLTKEIPLAIVGIVPCKVTAENGVIERGDLLVAASAPGHAMKGTDRARMLGAIVGKALEPLPGGTGVIQVLVTLQ